MFFFHLLIKASITFLSVISDALEQSIVIIREKVFFLWKGVNVNQIHEKRSLIRRKLPSLNDYQ